MKRVVIYTAVIWLLVVLTQCRSVRTNINEQTTGRTKIEYRDRTIRDTIAVHDSVYVYKSGDTLRVDRWRTRYVERWRRDTINVWHADTIRMVMRCYTEKELTAFEKLRLRAFPYLLLVILAMCVLWRVMR